MCGIARKTAAKRHIISTLNWCSNKGASWSEQMFADKSRNGTEKLCRLQPFRWTDKEVYTKPELSDLTAFCHWLQPWASWDDSTHHKLQVGWEGVPELCRWVRMCVSVYVWGLVGKYLFMLFLCATTSTFHCFTKAQTLCVCFGWFCLVFVCLICLAHRSEGFLFF